MTRPRLGIPVTYQFSVRYVLLTGMIERLGAFCDPVVLLSWDDPELEAEFEAAGAEVRRLPETEVLPEYRALREVLDHAFWRRLRSPTTDLMLRREDALTTPDRRRRRILRRAKYRAQLRVPGTERRLLDHERKVLGTHTNFRQWRDHLSELRLDAILSVTPYHRQEELLLRAAEVAGVPQCASVISFDNLTTRGWIPVTFDRYLLWNRHNQSELHRGYPETTDRPVEIVGAPQFDFYQDPTFLWSRREWAETIGVDLQRPVILFGGGPSRILPHEPHLVHQLDDAIDEGAVPGQPQVIFRRHPMDPPERWAGLAAATRHVVFDEPWRVRNDTLGHSPPGRVDVERLVSTLRWSDVHINVASTMSLDGAAFDRPQIGPAYDDRPGSDFGSHIAGLYRQEHWLPIHDSGGVTEVASPAELVDAVKADLDEPSRFAPARKHMLEEIITYLDGSATDRVVRGVASFLQAREPEVAS